MIRVHSRFVLLLVICISACKPATTEPDKPEPVERESVAAMEERLDATVWKDELLALRHENVIVALRDALRQGTNRVRVLADFDFTEIQVPRPDGSAQTLPLGIRRQRFTGDQRLTLSRDAWRETLARLGQAGWAIEDVFATHERFVPPTTTGSAQSVFAFELHGRRSAANTRFVARGILDIDWAVMPEGDRPVPDRLLIQDLVVLERRDRESFEEVGNVIPSAPARRGELVNLHPVIASDIDLDGDVDLILGGINQAMINDGEARFTAGSFIDESSFRGSQVAGLVADLNRDGHLDYLTVASHGGDSNRLVLHPGNGRLPFAMAPRVAAEGLRFPAPAVLTAGDVDGDGDLDVWLGQYRQPYEDGQMPTPFYDANDGYRSYLLLNDGTGQLQPASAPGDLIHKSHRRTIAASLMDLDADGDLDLVTINDFAGVDLFHNDGRGRFVDQTGRLYNRHLYGMALAVADFDTDGRLDLLVTGMDQPAVRRLDAAGLARADRPDITRMRTAMTYGNRLYLHRDDQWAKPVFADQLARAGWAWGTVAADFDNDGQADCFIANGNISGESVADYESRYWRHDVYLGNSQPNQELFVHFARRFEGVTSGQISYDGHQPNRFFLAIAPQEYLECAYLLNLARATDCRAAVATDLNNDGRVDLIVSELERLEGTLRGRIRLHVFLNNLPRGNRHWIGVRLDANPNNRSPLGAQVEVRTSDRRFPAQVMAGDSYQCQHPFRVHFGLGARDAIEEVRVRWPDGTVTRIQDPAIDAWHVVQ